MRCHILLVTIDIYPWLNISQEGTLRAEHKFVCLIFSTTSTSMICKLAYQNTYPVIDRDTSKPFGSGDLFKLKRN
jgi:hypothetical protein